MEMRYRNAIQSALPQHATDLRGPVDRAHGADAHVEGFGRWVGALDDKRVAKVLNGDLTPDELDAIYADKETTASAQEEEPRTLAKATA